MSSRGLRSRIPRRSRRCSSDRAAAPEVVATLPRSPELVAQAAPERPAPHDSDEAARLFAVDPRNNVVLEASAGTGKTSVLVAATSTC